jgi:hypothetical protein
VHLIGIAFEQAAAAHGEERVADEHQPFLREMKGDVPGGVGGDFKNGCGERSKRDRVALASDGIRCASAAGPVILHPVASLIATLPPVWSECQCVFQIWLIRQPRPAAASSTGCASAGSTTIVSPELSSCTSQM